MGIHIYIFNINILYQKGRGIMSKIYALLSAIIFVMVLSACQMNSEMTIYFESNNGDSIFSTVLIEGEPLTMPPEPVKEGAIFEGWFLDDGSFLEPFNYESVEPQPDGDDFTVYAKWLIETSPSGEIESKDDAEEIVEPEKPEEQETPSEEDSSDMPNDSEPTDSQEDPDYSSETDDSDTSEESEDSASVDDESTEEKEPEASTITLSDLDRLQSVDMCRIQQTKTHDGDPPQSKGFPLRYNVVPTKGVVNIAILAVDFPDVSGDPTLIDRWIEEVYKLEAWSNFVAGDAMEYRVHFEPKWITTPRDAKWYGCEGCLRQIQGDYEEGVTFRLQDEMDAIDEVFTAADDYYDWSEMDFAHMVFPPQAEAEPHWVRLYSHGGNNSTPKAGNVFVPVFGGFMGWRAPDFTDYTVWDLALHEILHEQGLMGHGPRNGASYSVMQNQHGYTDMILSWEAFLLDWWGEDQLSCLGIEELEEPFIFEIHSLDQNGIQNKGPINLMIPLNDEEIIVIEYRTDGPFTDLPEPRHGISAYHINVNQPQFRCDGCDDMTLEEYDERNFWRYLTDPTRKQACVEDEPHPVYGHEHNRYCDLPAFVHQPGAILKWEDIQITVLESNIIQVERIASEE